MVIANLDQNIPVIFEHPVVLIYTKYIEVYSIQLLYKNICDVSIFFAVNFEQRGVRFTRITLVFCS
jgi:hypothetical protein